MAGKIHIISPFNYKDGDISILTFTPLANAFKVGDTNCVSGKLIQDKEDVKSAYRDWLYAQTAMGIAYITHELDRIAYRLLDGSDVNLVSMNDVHGDIIKEIIYERLDSYRDQTSG